MFALLSSVFMLDGHPPRIIKFANFSNEIFLFKEFSKLSFNISFKDTLPVESPDSYRLIVCISIFPILPAPE